MFTPDDLEVRRLQPRDQKEVHHMISSVQRDEQQAELKRQIKALFLHPAIWVFAGVIICAVGITFDFPPIPTSIVILVLVWLSNKGRFTTYWASVRALFDSKNDDLQEPFKFYAMSRERRFFLVAQHRDRVVGTVAVREEPGYPWEAHRCLLARLFVHPACRRMGIASKLVADAAKRARELGYRRSSTRVPKTAMGARLLCESVGMEWEGNSTVAEAYPMHYELAMYTLKLAPEEGLAPSEEEEGNDSEEN